MKDWEIATFPLMKAEVSPDGLAVHPIREGWEPMQIVPAMMFEPAAPPHAMVIVCRRKKSPLITPRPTLKAPSNNQDPLPRKL